MWFLWVLKQAEIIYWLVFRGRTVYCVLRIECLCIFQINLRRKAVPWSGRLDAGFPPRRFVFYPISVHVGIVVDKATWEQGVLRVLRFSPLCITPPTPQAHLLLGLPVAFARRTKGQSLRTFQNAMFFFSEILKHWTTKNFQFSSV